MKSFLALLAFLTQAGLHTERVSIQAPDGVALDAALVLPDGPVRAPAVVALHGCGGPFPTRDGSWAVVLAHAGHIVLLPDSFGSRGLGSQCSVKDREVKPSKQRRGDAIAAAEWLTHRPGTPPGGVALIGWSNGGGTTLYTAAQRPDLPPGLFRRFVAFYPGCATEAREASLAALGTAADPGRRERRLDPGGALPRPGGTVPRPDRVGRLSGRVSRLRRAGPGRRGALRPGDAAQRHRPRACRHQRAGAAGRAAACTGVPGRDGLMGYTSAQTVDLRLHRSRYPAPAPRSPPARVMAGEGRPPTSFAVWRRRKTWVAGLRRP